MVRNWVMRSGAAALPSPRVAIRNARLVTGLVLFTYVASHLSNHALGLLGLDAMEAGRQLFLAVWRNPICMTALYGSLTIHLALALWALYQRRHLRMPFSETAQLLLGLAIPVFLITHVIGTHLANHLYGVIDSYTRMMLVFWSRPDMGIRQVLLLLIAWTHGCVGLHFWLRTKRWYPRAAPVFTAPRAAGAAARASRIPRGYAGDHGTGATRELVQETLAAAKELGAAQRKALSDINDRILAAYAAGVGLTLAARALRNSHERRYNSIAVTYPDGRKILAPSGYSVLEISRYRRRPTCLGVRRTRTLLDLPRPRRSRAEASAPGQRRRAGTAEESRRSRQRATCLSVATDMRLVGRPDAPCNRHPRSMPFLTSRILPARNWTFACCLPTCVASRAFRSTSCPTTSCFSSTDISRA